MWGNLYTVDGVSVDWNQRMENTTANRIVEHEKWERSERLLVKEILFHSPKPSYLEKVKQASE